MRGEGGNGRCDCQFGLELGFGGILSKWSVVPFGGVNLKAEGDLYACEGSSGGGILS